MVWIKKGTLDRERFHPHHEVMWIVKTKQGKYKYVERYLTPEHQQKYVSITLEGNRRQDKRYAEDFLRGRVRDILAEARESSTLTLKTLSERYYEFQQREFKPQTAEGTRHKVKTIVSLLGEDTLVSELTAPYVRNKLWAERASTYNERLKHYKAMLRFAYREELVDDISHIDRLQRRKDDPVRVKVQDKYLERDELKLLLDKMTETHWRLLTEFLALSGLRVGEAIALRKTDVDILDKKIHVTRTYSKVLDKITDSAKTDMSVRDVHIQPELMDCVMRIREFMKHFSSPYFFGWDESYISYDAYNKYMRENTERILGRRLTAHSLRHTHVALLAEAGVPLDAISRRLGHADSSITRDVYFHVTSKLQETENEYLDTVKLL